MHNLTEGFDMNIYMGVYTLVSRFTSRLSQMLTRQGDP